MIERRQPRFRVFDRLGFRLGVLLSMALLPVGLVAVTQANDVLNEARARSEAALMGETLRAAAPESAVIQRAQGAAEGLAGSVPAFMGDDVRCSAALRSFVDSSGIFTFAGFIPANGLVGCASSGAPRKYGSMAHLTDLMSNPRPSLRVNRSAPVSRQSVVIADHPVYAQTGDGLPKVIGILAVSVPHSVLSLPAQQGLAEEPITLFTFNEKGEVMTASGDFDAAQAKLPADRSLSSFVDSRPLAFTATSIDGTPRVFAVVPLVTGNLYAMGTWPAGSGRVAVLGALPALLFPALMWAVSLVVAWLATERLVTRHIRKLRASITSFARGSRIAGDLSFDEAPLEIREVAESYALMTETILHDEAEMEDMVHQKEVLLREVHHRVKNNLQLIASIMNMQMREARSPEARGLMRGLQDRVMSLATVHRGLYQTSGLTDVRADELLGEIANQVLNMATGPGRQFDVRMRFEPLRLTPDQAVPLALLLTEALTNAIKYAGAAEGERPWLELALTRIAGGTEGEPEQARLTVANALGPAQFDSIGLDGLLKGTGLGTQLVAAFSQQLGGQIDREHDRGAYRLHLTFVLSPLTEAEARHACEAQDRIEMTA